MPALHEVWGGDTNTADAFTREAIHMAHSGTHSTAELEHPAMLSALHTVLSRNFPWPQQTALCHSLPSYQAYSGPLPGR
mgnify:CR=1 FL=1